MTILCGSDFSENAEGAVRVAGLLARRLSAPLELVHVADDEQAVEASERAGQEPVGARARLRLLAERIAAETGGDVEALVEVGSPEDRLVEIAGRFDTRLLVVGSLGARKQHRWLLGSVAERVAQSSPVPVLVVRDAPRLEAWARGERPLRVMVGVEPTPLAESALRWASGLRAVGSCELVVAQIVWPGEEHRRIAGPAPMPLDRLLPEVEQALLHDLREWVGKVPDTGELSFLLKPGWGRVDAHLTQLASEADTDLLVVGTHQRSGVARMWQGSVSRGVLHGAATNVVSVPGGSKSLCGAQKPLR